MDGAGGAGACVATHQLLVRLHLPVTHRQLGMHKSSVEAHLKCSGPTCCRMHSGMDGDFRSKVVGEEARETHRELLVPSAASVRDINSQSCHRSPGRRDALGGPVCGGWAALGHVARAFVSPFAAHNQQDLIKGSPRDLACVLTLQPRARK